VPDHLSKVKNIMDPLAARPQRSDVL